MSDIVERLVKLQVASCNCGTKTPELKYHADDCHYRGHAESEAEITSLRQQLSTRDAEVTRKALQMAGENIAKHRAIVVPDHDVDNQKPTDLVSWGYGNACVNLERLVLALSPDTTGYVMVPVDDVRPMVQRCLDELQIHMKTADVKDTLGYPAFRVPAFSRGFYSLLLGGLEAINRAMIGKAKP